MGAEHRADLADELRLALEDLPAALDQLVALFGRVDVLRRPAVGARIVALAGVLDQAVEDPPAPAHALHGDHLALEREDRLHLQRRADPGAGRADASAALQEFERVDGEPHLQLRAGRPGPPPPLPR